MTRTGLAGYIPGRSTNMERPKIHTRNKSNPYFLSQSWLYGQLHLLVANPVIKPTHPKQLLLIQQYQNKRVMAPTVRTDYSPIYLFTAGSQE